MSRKIAMATFLRPLLEKFGHLGVPSFGHTDVVPRSVTMTESLGRALSFFSIEMYSMM